MTRKRDLIYTILQIAFALGIALIITRFPFEYFESLSYDARFRLSPPTPISNKITLIAWDKNSLSEVGHAAGASEHVKLLETILPYQPRAILYLTSPLKIFGMVDEREKLAKLMESFPNLYVAYDGIALDAEKEKIKIPAPFQSVRVVSGPVSRDLKSFAGDDVSRRAVIAAGQDKMVHTLIADLFLPMDNIRDYRGAFDYRESLQTYIDFRPKGSYPLVTFQQILRGIVDPRMIRGHVVIIGSDTETDTEEYVRTPFSRDVLGMSVLEAHANILDTLMQDTGVERAPRWVDLLLTCAISLLIAFVVFALRPVQGVVILLGTVVSFSLISYAIFALFRIWIEVAHPLFTVFICYYLFIPYRLIREYRKRWEYQQKNKLLTEVEELKTNFLSMMSHDLKTPLARIQGMAELALRNPQTLGDDQKEALQTISESSEELAVFISSILSLGRIESKELKLNIQSKDVNALLDEVIRKHQYLAKAKNIEIRTEFEPLFSIKIDVDLMRQVFSNLIENAIKYSRPDTKILVSTDEHDNQVVIQVADQGDGIPPDELPHVFLKFYRSRDAKSSPIKGSGLGLYLAKYFVELHQGRVSVESVMNQGSTFTVTLPMQT